MTTGLAKKLSSYFYRHLKSNPLVQIVSVTYISVENIRIKMYDSIAVSNYFIRKANEEGVGATPMKILKLVYLAHGWYLGNFKEPLINENVLAWKYGPVIREVYNAFRIYGSSHVSAPHIKVSSDFTDIEADAFLDYVWHRYKSHDGLYLSSITHEENSPWDITYKTNGQGAIIPTDLIRDYYVQKVESAKRKRSNN